MSVRVQCTCHDIKLRGRDWKTHVLRKCGVSVLVLVSRETGVEGESFFFSPFVCQSVSEPVVQSVRPSAPSAVRPSVLMVLGRALRWAVPFTLLMVLGRALHPIVGGG